MKNSKSAGRKKRPAKPPRTPDVVHRGVLIPGTQYKTWAEYERYLELRQPAREVLGKPDDFAEKLLARQGKVSRDVDLDWFEGTKETE